ncbi:baseplate J/gp47 family protein [Serratia liquefaciens]|uniref:baseplate J/gp47 family protein n=1 Tax=Serratia liquefaciens TaxID=614 RepID=UPI00061B6417|nr:baseplate J/gp47 family protein [Serratia liquefaciens]AKE09222.1 bacteriophage protein [Serratia liquefaciens]
MADSVVVTTAVPAVTITETGLAIPDELDILNGRLSDLDTAMGGGMSTSLTTPQGQIAMSDTAIIAAKNDELAELTNLINPDYTYGRYQDGIARIYFIDRIAATGTLVTGVCEGLVGTVIPANSIAQDASGYLYYSLSPVTIPASGSVDVVFQNQATGPIACPIGALNTIYRAVTGWSSVSNLAAGVLGNDVEGRANFEYRRKQSVAKNARNTLASVYAAVLAVDGVSDAYVTDNKTSSAVNKGATNYSVLAHSIYVAVYGGSESGVGNAIFNSAPPGVNMNGSTTFVVQDDENYVYPYPEYTIKWVTPAAVSVHFKVEIESNDSLPSNITSLIQQAIISAFNGEDGGTRARIGSKIFAGRYYAGVQAIDQSNINILGITLSKNGTTFSSSVEFGIDQIPTIDATNIVVELVT